MKYIAKQKKNDAIRDYNIEMSIEQYIAEQQKHMFELLDEIETYPAGLQKQLFNYKFNYDDEQEMLSREVIHMYKTGATDPRLLLNQLMKDIYENGEDDDNDDQLTKKMRHRIPNLTCFKKKQEDDAAN